MKHAIIPVLLSLMLTLGAAGCDAEDYLNPERNSDNVETPDRTSYGNVSTTRNGVVNGDNRNLVSYAEQLAAERIAGSR